MYHSIIRFWSQARTSCRRQRRPTSPRPRATNGEGSVDHAPRRRPVRRVEWPIGKDRAIHCRFREVGANPATSPGEGESMAVGPGSPDWKCTRDLFPRSLVCEKRAASMDARRLLGGVGHVAVAGAPVGATALAARGWGIIAAPSVLYSVPREARNKKGVANVRYPLMSESPRALRRNRSRSACTGSRRKRRRESADRSWPGSSEAPRRWAARCRTGFGSASTPVRWRIRRPCSGAWPR